MDDEQLGLPLVHAFDVERTSTSTILRCPTCGRYLVISADGFHTINQGDFYARHFAGTTGFWLDDPQLSQ